MNLSKHITVPTLFLGIVSLLIITFSSSPDAVSDQPVIQSGGMGSVFLLGASEGEQAHGKEKKSHEKKGQPWMELLVHLSGIVVLALIYVIWVHEPTKDALSNRRDEIQSSLEDAQQGLKNIEGKTQEVEEKLDHVEEEFEEERRELLQKGKRMKEETIEEGEKQAEERIQRAEQEIQMAREQARLEIEQTLKHNVVKIIHRYFEEKSGDQLHRQFVNSFFDSLDSANSISEFRRGFASSNGTANQEENTT